MLKLFTILLVSIQLISCNTVKKYTQNFSPSYHKMNVRVTAYAAVEDKVYRNKSAVGTILKTNYSLATDWSKIPYGTIVKFDGRIYKVEDYGSALVRNEKLPIVDLYVANRAAIRKWGSREKEIEIIRWGSFAESKKILESRLHNKHCLKMYNLIVCQTK